jgi:transposase-like protein
MGHKKVGVPSRRYTDEFKIEAVKLGHSVGMSEASRRLGIPDSSLFNAHDHHRIVRMQIDSAKLAHTASSGSK